MWHRSGQQSQSIKSVFCNKSTNFLCVMWQRKIIMSARIMYYISAISEKIKLSRYIGIHFLLVEN